MNMDTIIIGAGTMGMAAGYYLSKQGKKVALIDVNDPPHTEGSHHGETRLIRHAYGEGEHYVELALRASELWSELEKMSGRKVFHNTGVLNIGAKDSTFIQNVIESAKKYALPVDILTGQEINSRWDGYHIDEDLIGCYEPSSGVLMSEEAIRAYREPASKHGAKIYTNTVIEELHVKDNQVDVRFGGEHVTAKSLMITAGKGTNKVLSFLDEKLPLTPVRKTFSWFHSSEKMYGSNDFPAWSYVDGKRTYYGFPSVGNAGIKIGRHDGGIPVTIDQNLEPFGTYPEDKQDVRDIAAELFSEEITHKEGKVCTYTRTPDDDFIIDRLPGYDNIIVACGFSGHGFKFGSVIGELLSQLAIGGETSFDLTPFSIRRFEG